MDGFKCVAQLRAVDVDAYGRVKGFDLLVNENYIEFAKAVAQALLSGETLPPATTQPNND
jgi:hypothetical protein